MIAAAAEIVEFVAERAVGVVFVVAGASKIARAGEWPVQARQLGAPRWVIPLLPWWEIVVGASLVSGLFEPWPAIAALATLAVFTVLLVRRLLEGRHPPCACFGAWSTAPLGWRHVARNIGFILLCVIALVNTISA